jgi:hypothetical protein
MCHVYGIAAAFDVVYNYAGGFTVIFDAPTMHWFRTSDVQTGR